MRETKDAAAEIVLVGTLAARLVEEIGKHWRLHVVAKESDIASLPAPLRDRIEMVIAAAPVGSPALSTLPRLRFVLNAGIGYDQLDLAALHAAPVAIANLAGIGGDCVADMAIALLLDVARGTTRGDRFVREGKWGRVAFPTMHRITGRRLGILGLGSIGSQIARRAEGFGMSVAYHNRREIAGSPYRYAATPRDLAAMSDHLALAVPGGVTTRHLVDAGVLAALPPHGIVVNVGRGSLIDQAALVDALRSGRLFGAGLDVIDGEPAVPEALLALDNVVVTPHRAGSTFETLEDALQRMLQTLEAWHRNGANLAPI